MLLKAVSLYDYPPASDKWELRDFSMDDLLRRGSACASPHSVDPYSDDIYTRTSFLQKQFLIQQPLSFKGPGGHQSARPTYSPAVCIPS